MSVDHASDAKEPKPGEVIDGKYRLEAVLGHGGMSVVYAARHTVTHRRVAIKWLRSDFARRSGGVERFLREAQSIGRIEHPNVVEVFDVLTRGDDRFLVMELLHGPTLADVVARGPLHPADAVDIVLGVLGGVGAAHQLGIIHRDLKPENVLLCPRPHGPGVVPKVVDFGISKFDEGGRPKLTQAGTALGTPSYMSPEQLRGEAQIDARTDLYALGVMLYEALTGKLPFDGDTFAALAFQIATATPPAPDTLREGLPSGLGAVALRAMARERDDRYADAAELAAALGPYHSGTATYAQLGVPAPNTPDSSSDSLRPVGRTPDTEAPHSRASSIQPAARGAERDVSSGSRGHITPTRRTPSMEARKAWVP